MACYIHVINVIKNVKLKKKRKSYGMFLVGICE